MSCARGNPLRASLQIKHSANMAWPATRPLNECVNGTRLGAAIVPGQRPHESAAHEDHEENGGHSVHACADGVPPSQGGEWYLGELITDP